jgi:F-type H+-transporting ATPase subunit epsilon
MLSIEIVLKKGCVFESDNVLSVILKTRKGKIQILPNHENMMVALEMDEVVIEMPENKRRVAIIGGLADVSNNRVTILAEEAQVSEEIIKEEIEKAIALAENQIASSVLPPTELIQLEKQLKYQKFIKELGNRPQ